MLFFNIQCAVLFLWKPEVFAPSFELAEAPGIAMVRGLGLLFLMWNVPYAVALSNPQKHRISLYEAIAMQTIALVGETFIYLTLPATHPIRSADLDALHRLRRRRIGGTAPGSLDRPKNRRRFYQVRRAHINSEIPHCILL